MGKMTPGGEETCPKVPQLVRGRAYQATDNGTSLLRTAGVKDFHKSPLKGGFWCMVAKTSWWPSYYQPPFGDDSIEMQVKEIAHDHKTD